MPIFCKTCQGIMCDFCRWHDNNAAADGSYTEGGYCRLHKTYMDPDDGCDDFYCSRVSFTDLFSVSGPGQIKGE